MNEIVNIEQFTAAEEDMGGLWVGFIKTLIPEQAEQINRAYNLISLALRENSLSVSMTQILTDENVELGNIINIVKRTLIDSLIELLTNMGVILNHDYIELNSLDTLSDIIDVFYSTDGMDDVLGLIDILDNETYDNKDKLIRVILRYLQKEDYESDSLDYIIEEVSGDVIKGLYIGLGVYTVDDGNYINPDIAKRIRANKTFLEGKLANKHILNGGGVGLSYECYCNLFINEISEFLVEGGKKYMEEILGICIISSLTNTEISEGFEIMMKDASATMEDIYYGNELLRKINL